MADMPVALRDLLFQAPSIRMGLSKRASNEAPWLHEEKEPCPLPRKGAAGLVGLFAMGKVWGGVTLTRIECFN